MSILLLIEENYSKSRGYCCNCKLLKRQCHIDLLLTFFFNMLNYRILIVQKENDIVLQNQWYLWFALIDFLAFRTKYEQDQRLESDINLFS